MIAWKSHGMVEGAAIDIDAEAIFISRKESIDGRGAVHVILEADTINVKNNVCDYGE